MADINKLKDKIKSTIYPNGKGAINASDHQAMLLDMADGMAETDTKLATLSSETKQEISEIAGEYIDDAEYIRAYLDKEGRFLWGIKVDGSVDWAKGIPYVIQDFVDKKYDLSKEQIDFLTAHLADLGNVVNKDLFSLLITKLASDCDGNMEMTIDAEQKILAWRGEDGVRHENKLQIEQSLSLSQSAMSEFIKSLIASGFSVNNPIDLSNEKKITIPLPRYCAVVNVISPIGSLAANKTQDIPCEIEYLDKSGNYFKKYIILNAQGSSSMAYIEKNQSIDIFNDEDRTESCDLIFGNWVAQDSFHWKCYYIDVFRGICNVAYKWCEEVIKAMNCRNNRIIKKYDEITEFQSSGQFATDFGDGALCHPDGFPFELHINGEYYGLYVWNLKKHRKNYSMKKSDYNAVLLDGDINNDTFFDGSIDWSNIELRNPKDLITMTGGKYDGDNPQELIDSTSSAYDANNSTHVKTASTKALLQRQANAISQIKTTNNVQTARALYESYYDKDMMICYFIVANVLYHSDGLRKNWIWTFFGEIAAPTFYDMDSIFGRAWMGTYIYPNSTETILGLDADIPVMSELVRLYKDEIDATYQMLREKGVIDVANIMSYVNGWIDMVTLDALEKNLEKWPSIPSYRKEKTIEDGTESGGMYDSPMRINKWLVSRIATLDNYFNYGG